MICTRAGASRRSSFAKTARSEKQTLQARTTARAKLPFGPASATPPPVASATPATMGASVAYVAIDSRSPRRSRARAAVLTGSRALTVSTKGADARLKAVFVSAKPTV